MENELTPGQRAKKIDHIRSLCQEHDSEYTAFLGGDEERNDYAEAIIGVQYRPEGGLALVYSRSILLECIMRQMEGSNEDVEDPYMDAVEHYEYNIIRSLPYLQKPTIPPIMMDDWEE